MKLVLQIFILFTILTLPLNLVGQKSGWNQIRKANKLLSFGKVEKAVEKYESILKETPNNAAANFQLGKIQLLDLEDFGKAEKYLSTATKNFGNKDTIYMAFYYLAETQKLLGNFPEAIENYTLFKNKGIKDVEKSSNLVEEVNEKIDECKLAQTYVKDKKYTFTRVINLGENVNSTLSEYCSIFFPSSEQLMYTARYQDTKKEKRFMDFKFYEGGYTMSDTGSSAASPVRLKFDNVDQSHFSVVSKTTLGDTVIFYKDNKLWLSTMKNGDLSSPVLLPEAINKNYYQPHGTFSPDSKYFIFSSSGKDIQLDLYRIDVKGNNAWGEPQLLSDNINTKYNEDSPFFSADGKTLYFSSNKPGGFGKYDIYFSKLKDGEWSSPLNIGMPINSSGEDIFFSLNSDKKTGFLSSNRGGGYGAMDIYMFTEQPYPSFDCEEYLAANGNVGKNEIMVLDELVMKESIGFDVSTAKLKGARVSNVFWKVDEQILKLDSPLLTYTFTDPGVHTVSTQIYGKDRSTDSYVMDCATQQFTIMEEGPLFLEIETDRMAKVKENTIIDASMFYLGENKMITDYQWFIDEDDIRKNKQSYNYTFADTGFHELKVIATVVDQINETSYQIVSTKTIFIYDDSHAVAIGEDGVATIPGLDLFDNKNSSTGKINAMKGDLYGVPDDSRVFYSWYIDNAEIKGRQTDLLTYDFKPLSTVTLKALVVPKADDEDEFTLEASKVIPPYEVGVLANNQTDPNTTTNTNTNTTTTATVGQIVDETGGKIDSTTNGSTDPIVIVDPVATVNVNGVNYDIAPVYFLFDKFYLTSRAKATIDKNIIALKANPNLKILVEGNTDSMGPASYNLKLSEKRAKSVYEYMKKNGITDKQITGINPNGEKLPKAPNTVAGKDNPKGRKENRRVDFTIVQG